MCDFSQNKNSRTAQGEPPCVRCGYCCNKRVCFIGVEDEEGKCNFLEVADEKLRTFSCKIRETIIEMEKNSLTPMFDNYCSGTVFNDVRDKVIAKLKEV